MISVYLDNTIRQAQERAKILKTKIPTPVPSMEYIALQRLCEDGIDYIINQLDYLLTDPIICGPELIREKIRLFRRLQYELSHLEATAIIALSRPHEDDVFLNQLVFQIHREINYPLVPPNATCLSRGYFQITPSFCLLEVPPAESDFLLHLPDLYHEIAHMIIATLNNPKVDPFRYELAKFLGIIEKYIEEERVANLRSTGPTNFNTRILELFERNWINWAEELFCDLFAVYTLGPAYAWAHFHLTAKCGGDPFDISLTMEKLHPPDQARMEAILIGLELIGYSAEAAEINQKWNELIKAIGSKPNPIYRKACPQSILEQAAIHAFQGTSKIKCRVVQPNTTNKIHDLLNTAWKRFWEDPDTYPVWERESIANLKQKVS
jgi:hypothetical protein